LINTYNNEEIHNNVDISEVLPFIAGIASFLVAGGLVAWITKQPSGSKEMMDI
jgi:K(+)-stimulated pyrophosphate-energized sodium pump